MESSRATLYLLSGKIASGKSTVAKTISKEKAAILINQDEWLSSLYPFEINNIEDYSKCFRRLTKVLGKLVVDVLGKGQNVVLDFPANTIEVRKWMKSLVDLSGANNELHVLNVSDSVCIQRLQKRNKEGDHPYSVSDEEFERFSNYYSEPENAEGFNLVIHE